MNPPPPPVSIYVDDGTVSRGEHHTFVRCHRRDAFLDTVAPRLLYCGVVYCIPYYTDGPETFLGLGMARVVQGHVRSSTTNTQAGSVGSDGRDPAAENKRNVVEPWGTVRTVRSPGENPQLT